MPSILKNILILFLGIIIGSIVNMGLVMLGPMIISPPEGMIATDIESIKEHLHLLKPQHYLFPFLAHAIGTLVGATLVATLVKENKIQWAMAVGAIFMIGGVTNLVSMSSPIWFTMVDLSLAYLPMAFLGYLLRRK